MDKKEYDKSIQELVSLGLIRIEKYNDDEGDDLIIETEFNKWLQGLQMTDAYLSMPSNLKKILRNAFEDPNGQFDPSILQEQD